MMVAFFIAGRAWTRMKDKKYLRKRTREAISPEMLQEIINEKATFLKRQTNFTQTLLKIAEQKKTPLPSEIASAIAKSPADPAQEIEKFKEKLGLK